MAASFYGGRIRKRVSELGFVKLVFALIAAAGVTLGVSAGRALWGF